MDKIRLGKTELMVTRTAMGCLPIQRTDMEMAKRILRKAFDNGINFIDTAIRYTDSEEKLGATLGDVREQYILATKTPAKTKQDALADVHKTLERTRSTYVDLYQIHNYTGDIAAFDDPNSAYAGLLEAKEQGLVRHIGITSHVPAVAKAAILSGKFETLQFPFNYLSGALEDELIALCKEHDMGFIAMKALSGGMVGSVPATFAYIRQYDNVVPIFGIQHEWELDEFLALDKNPPTVDEEMLALFEKDKKELGSEFCRACGYCNIPISVYYSAADNYISVIQHHRLTF